MIDPLAAQAVAVTAEQIRRKQEAATHSNSLETWYDRQFAIIEGSLAEADGRTAARDRIDRMMLGVEGVLSLPPPEPMVGDYLDRGMIASMPGKFGSLKTFALISMALSVATGRDWLDQPIHAPGKVVYASLEGAYTLKDRYNAWLVEHGEAPPANLRTWPHPLNLLDAETVDEFADWLAEDRPHLVVIDTLSKATPGAEENGSVDMSRAYAAAARFRDASGAAVIFAHHTGHGSSERGRGHSGFEDDADVVLPIVGQWKDGPTTLKCTKQKARQIPPPIGLRLEVTPAGPVLQRTDPPGKVDDTQELKGLILAKVQKYPGELTRGAVADDSDSKGYIAEGNRAQRRRAIETLLAEGKLEDHNLRKDGDRQARDYLIPAGWKPEAS